MREEETLGESGKLEFSGIRNTGKNYEHKETVLRFMSKKQALCIKDKNEIAGVILFSRKHNMICCLAVSLGFVEDELIEEFGYPNQRFVLRS